MTVIQGEDVATISVRVEGELRDRAEETAASAGMSISEWTRHLMRSELGMEVPDWSAPTSLSKRERLHLVLLHRLARSLTEEIDETEHHGRMVEVLEHGFAAEYSDEFAAIYDELAFEECRLVMDILDMFRVLGSSAEAVARDAVEQMGEHAEHALAFAGFDFNSSREGRMADYAGYLIRQGRWTELAVHFDDEHERGNSHMPMLDTYLRMLAVYKPIWENIVRGVGRGRYLLDEDELAQVVRAWPYPR